MIVEAIADFTPQTLLALKGHSGQERERSRSREKDRKSESRVTGQLVGDSSSLTVDKSEEASTTTKYTYFSKDDLIKVTANAGNGWWFGYVVDSADGTEGSESDQGFFPSNYVQQLKSLEQPEKKEATDGGRILLTQGEDTEAGFNKEEQVFDPHDIDYSNYAQNYTDRERVGPFKFKRLP